MAGQVTVQVCPVCHAWQIDYTLEALAEAVGMMWPPERMSRAANELIEAELVAHLRECFGIPDGPPPGPMCPECRAGKHPNCNGQAWNDDLDDVADCACAAAGHPS